MTREDMLALEGSGWDGDLDELRQDVPVAHRDSDYEWLAAAVVLPVIDRRDPG